MVYIWAWQAPPLQPERWISSSTAAAGGEAQARAAVFLRDQHRQEARLGQGGDELGRIAPLAVQRAPVGAGKARAELAHRLADFGKALAGVMVHGDAPYAPIGLSGERQFSGSIRSRSMTVRSRSVGTHSMFMDATAFVTSWLTPLKLAALNSGATCQYWV